MTFKDFIHLLNESKRFRDSLLNILATSEFETYRWEMRELTQETYHRPVEFIIVDEPGLYDIYEDTQSFRSKTIRVELQNFLNFNFSEYWYDRQNNPIGPVAVFPNLSGSSMLLTPTPPISSYDSRQYDFYAPQLRRKRFSIKYYQTDNGPHFGGGVFWYPAVMLRVHFRHCTA